MDKMLAGNEPIDTLLPIELFAGEKPVVTDSGTVASGLVLGTRDDQGHTNLFAIVALVGGVLVAHDPADDAGAEIVYGVLPHAINTSATGYNAATDAPVYREGVFNFAALQTSMTYAQAKAAFARSGMHVRQLA